MAKAASRRKPSSRRKWSASVTRNSDALDLEHKVFAKRTPTEIARSLKRSAERSRRRRKPAPFRSAMSMLTFLYQPGRQEPAEEPPARPRKRQAGAAQGVWTRRLTCSLPQHGEAAFTRRALMLDRRGARVRTSGSDTGDLDLAEKPIAARARWLRARKMAPRRWTDRVPPCFDP